MRVCHSRAIIDFQDYDPAEAPEAHWEDDRDRYIMSAVEVRELGGIKRPQARHRWLNQKYKDLADMFETSPYNRVEPGEGEGGIRRLRIGLYLYQGGRLLVRPRI